MWPYLNNVISDCKCNNCTPSTSICYVGENLTCIGVNNNDTLSIALQKINTLMCEPFALISDIPSTPNLQEVLASGNVANLQYDGYLQIGLDGVSNIATNINPFGISTFNGTKITYYQPNGITQNGITFNIPTKSSGVYTLATTSDISDSRPYKVYTAFLNTIFASSVPTVFLLENTLGYNITWTKIGTGSYLGTVSSPIFTSDKTVVNLTPRGAPHFSLGGSNTTTTVYVQTYNLAGSNAEPFLKMDTIEIRVYN